MRPRLDRRSRVGLGLLATGLTLTLWAEANQPEPTKAPTNAPTVTSGSTHAPPGLRHTTELEEHVCQENTQRGNPPWTEDCRYVLVDDAGRDVEIWEDDPYGRWDCKTMGNRICAEWNPTMNDYELIYYPPGWPFGRRG